jgi:hypothetical protein
MADETKILSRVEDSTLIEIDNEIFDELYNLAKAIHPNVADCQKTPSTVSKET